MFKQAVLLSLIAFVAIGKHSHKRAQQEDEYESVLAPKVRAASRQVQAADYLKGFVRGFWGSDVGDFSRCYDHTTASVSAIAQATFNFHDDEVDRQASDLQQILNAHVRIFDNDSNCNDVNRQLLAKFVKFSEDTRQDFEDFRYALQQTDIRDPRGYNYIAMQVQRSAIAEDYKGLGQHLGEFFAFIKY